MLTIYLDGQAVRRMVDMGLGVTILTEIETLLFPHWKFRPDPPFRGVGGQTNSKLATCPVHWKELDSIKGVICPIVSLVLRNLGQRHPGGYGCCPDY